MLKTRSFLQAESPALESRGKNLLKFGRNVFVYIFVSYPVHFLSSVGVSIIYTGQVLGGWHNLFVIILMRFGQGKP